MEVMVVYGPGSAQEFIKNVDGWHINDNLLTVYKLVDEMQDDVAAFYGWHAVKIIKE